MNLLRAIAAVGGMTMISRVFGFIRDILIANVLGAGLMTDALFVAFRLPNLFRRLFAEGAFAAAFVPLYSKRLEGAGQPAADEFASRAFNVLLWSLVALTAVVEAGMPWLMRVLAPGFLDQPEKFELAVLLTRITFPYLLFISLVTLLAGVMNSLGRFWQAAATPILLNLCLIGAVLIATRALLSPGHAIAWFVFAAGVVQLAWMAFHAWRAGVRIRLARPRLSEDVVLLLKRMAPVAVGAGVYQVNLLVDTIIASTLPEGSISYLFYADRVTQLPLGVVGVAVGTALLPLLSRQLASGDEAGADNSLNRSLEFTLLLAVPAAVALAVIAEPVIRVLFQRGAFDSDAARATAGALAAYAWGIPAYVLVKALATGFFAREDTKTPVVIAAVAAVVNVALALTLKGPFLHVGIAMATAISAWLNAGALAFVLARRGQLRMDERLRRRLPRTVVSAAGMGLFLWGAFGWAEAPLAAGEGPRILALAALVAGGGAVFAALAWTTGAARPADLAAFRRREDTSDA